jgi:hypothetical protein
MVRNTLTPSLQNAECLNVTPCVTLRSEGLKSSLILTHKCFASRMWHDESVYIYIYEIYIV